MGNKGFKVWYRHSGEDEIDSLPFDPELKRVEDYEEISRDIGSSYITHMQIKLIDVMPPLFIMCPLLTHLVISGIQRSHSLDCLRFLQQLEMLDMRYSDFSEGLPDVISELSTLRVLYLWDCKLKDLSQSMKSLHQLETLYLPLNDFSKGLPNVISELSTLRVLSLRGCTIKDLPQSLHLLSHLVKLDISSNHYSWNYFTTLPPVVYQLSNLQELDIKYNRQLQTITVDILKLTKLEELDCYMCESLVTPPYAVCQQGLPAIKKYFKDLRDEGGTELAVVPVAVVGNLMAGKTSLIRSLKVGKRELTFREDNSPLDEATQVFSVESVQLQNSLVKLIDFGGHSVYHLAYQLTVKQQCIPMIAINLEEYDKLSSERGVREATRRLCIDWMSHLYLACPRLGAPVLILTHRDKLSDEQFELTKHHLLTTAEIIRNELMEEERGCSENLSEFCQILHLSNLDKPLFDPADTFVFGKDSTVTTNIQNVKDCLEKRCDEFKMAIPRLWERVSLNIGEEAGKPYVLLSDVKAAFPDSQEMEVILRYLHNSGEILWFENKPTLTAYIFHQIPEITKMIAVLFHHSGDERWEERIANVTGFRHNDQFIEKQMFEEFVNQFKRDGVLNETVLTYLMKAESKFPQEIAVELLSIFHIIHGPIQQEIGTGYIIPYFSKKYMDREWLSDGDVQLWLDIEFNGLPIPKYVYHLMTVIALNFQTDSTHLQNVACNGVTILHGDSSTHLIHDYNNNKVTLQISTPVKLIGPSWRRLLELAQHIVNKTIEVWKASRPVFRFYCSHCLYMRVDNPDTTINPSWFTCAQQHSPHDDHPHSVRTFTGVEPVHCARAESSMRRQLTVPKPLRFPCYELTDEAISKLEKYLSKLRESYPLSTTEIRSSETSTAASEDESEDDADSVCSDIVEAGYADFTNPELEYNICCLVDLKPTSRRKVQSLFYNTNEVYQMTDPVRGRVMIINNQVFFKGEKLVDNREGSDIDYDNISRLFSDMDFKIVKEEDPMTDLTKEEIFSEIQQETQLSDHHALGMFVLVILSHGTRGGIFLDTNCQPVDLVDVKDLLSASKFPAMKGKPKIIIVQACSGDRLDFGDAVDPQEASSPTPATATPASPPATSSSVPQEVKPHIEFSKLTYLDADDFYIMKPSTESYKAMRYERYGTWFIRILVATFYKHSCHMDIEQLFKIVQARVRQASITYCEQKGEANVGGNVPSSPECTFTHLRKLYLFPKYTGT